MRHHLIASLIALLLAPAAFAEPGIIENGKQPIVQHFLTKHDILQAPNTPRAPGSLAIEAKDYNGVSTFPAHDRKWSFEKGGYVLKTSGKRDN